MKPVTKRIINGKLACLALAACFPLVACVCQADTNSLTPDDLVTFFKQALKSPPDVESFTARKHSFLPPPVYPTNFLPPGAKLGPPLELFGGGRAGSNFYYGVIDDAASAGTAASIRVTAGRAGSNVYAFSRNAISYIIGSNAMRGSIDFSFGALSYLLNLGVGDIKPESVVWEGDKFTAVDLVGNARLGELELSNGLPHTLTLRAGKYALPVRSCEYTYPNPAGSLGGFPAKILISYWDGMNLVPSEEIELLSIQVAPQPLSDDFFDPSKFTGPNIKWTNIYSNEFVYAQIASGRNAGAFVRSSASQLRTAQIPALQMKNAAQADLEDPADTDNPRRFVFLLIVLIVTALIAVAIRAGVAIRKNQR